MPRQPPTVRVERGVSAVIDANTLLARLGPCLSPGLRRVFELVPLHKNDCLLRAGEHVRDVYFPTGGLVSVSTATTEGQAVDLATIAHEGMVGVSVALERSVAPHDAIVRLAGAAIRVGSGALCLEIQGNERLRATLLAYASRLSMEIAQAVACQCFHTALPRLCRWLLIASDRTNSDVLEITQESLAHILGVARPVVTKASIELQNAGAVRCRHGRITIVNRSMLERSACECFSALRPSLEDGGNL